MKAKGIKWFATVTTVSEAKTAESAGADAVIAQGMEAGGHRSAFDVSRAETGMVGLFSLIPSVADAVKIPVVATGGIADGRGTAAALLLGASAVQIGTAFLRCPEAKIPSAWADAIGKAAPEDTVLAGVSNTKLSLTGAQMRQAVLDNIRNYPGTLPPRPLTFPQLENLAQFVVEVDFDFNSAVIRPSSYRTIGAIADALRNPILLGYGILVIGHTDSVGGRQYNVGLSQRRAEAIRDALVDPFNVNPAVLDAVGMGEEQLRDPAHPTSGVNRRVQLINVGGKFCFSPSGERYVCQ